MGEIMTPLELEIEKICINHFLHSAIKNSKLNGSQMRQVLDKFCGEVCGA